MIYLINKLFLCLFLCKSNTSRISSCLFILILITCCSSYMPYLIASSFLLNSLSYLIIPPPCLTICLGGPFVHPHTCSVAFCHTSFIAFHLLSILSASNTSSFLSVTNRPNSCFTLGSLSFRTFSLGMCTLFFFLGAELMTSPTSNRCCDTYSSPAMTLTFLKFVGHIFATASNQLRSLYHQIHRYI